MADTTFTFRVDSELKAAFDAMAEGQERTAAQLLRMLMREAVQRWSEAEEHDAWFRAEVEQAVDEAGASAIGRIPQDQVVSSWRQQRAEIERRTVGGRG